MNHSGLGGHHLRPPDHRAAVWDQAAGHIESIVLATVHMWTSRGGKKEVLNLIVRHFVPEDVFEVNCVLAESVGAVKPGGRRDSAERAACDAYALDLYDRIVNLVAAQKMPKVVVSSLALPMVPRAELKTSDEMGVAARLESLEQGLVNVTAALGKLTAVQPGLQHVGGSLVPPIVTVTAPAQQAVLGQGQAAAGQVQHQVPLGGGHQGQAGLGLGQQQAGLGLGQQQAGLGLGKQQAGLGLGQQLGN